MCQHFVENLHRFLMCQHSVETLHRFLMCQHFVETLHKFLMCQHSVETLHRLVFNVSTAAATFQMAPRIVWFTAGYIHTIERTIFDKKFFFHSLIFKIFSLQKTVEALGVGVENRHTSPFRSVYWVIFVQLWAATCLVFVTWNHLASL
jgi:hypothetical protein